MICATLDQCLKRRNESRIATAFDSWVLICSPEDLKHVEKQSYLSTEPTCEVSSEES